MKNWGRHDARITGMLRRGPAGVGTVTFGDKQPVLAGQGAETRAQGAPWDAQWWHPQGPP